MAGHAAAALSERPGLWLFLHPHFSVISWHQRAGDRPGMACAPSSGMRGNADYEERILRQHMTVSDYVVVEASGYGWPWPWPDARG